MIRLFRKSKILFVVLFFAGLFLLSSLFICYPVYQNGSFTGYRPLLPFGFVSHDPSAIDLLIPLLLILSFCAAYLAAKRAAKQEYQRVMNLLLKDCDPDAFIREFSPVLNLCANRPTAPGMQLTLLNAYIARGDFSLAAEMLASMLIDERNASSLYYNAVIYNDLSICFLHLNNLPGAKLYLQKVREQLNKTSEYPEMNQNIRVLYRNLEHRVSPEHYSPEQNIEHFYHLAHTSPERYSRVTAFYYLAVLYAKQGDDEKASEACAYIIAHAPRAAVSADAKALLQTLQRK